MKNIVFVSYQKELIEDLNITVEMGFGKYPYSLTCLDTLEDIESVVAKIHPDLIVLSYDALSKRDAWSFGDIPIAYHAMDREELNKGAEYGYPTIGIASDSETLAEKLGEEPYSAGKYVKKGSAKKSASDNDDEQKSPHGKASERLGEKHDDDEEPSGNSLIEELDDLEEDDDYIGDDDEVVEIQVEPDDDEDADEDDALDEEDEELKAKPAPKPAPKPQKEQTAEHAKAQEKRKPKPEKDKKEEKEPDYIEKEFQKDLIKDKHDTKVVTVYSAKGGVGKTTIATELATYLSLVSIGRRRLRVCLVDYNIDFGDVRMTLNLNSKHLNLTDWSAEVQEYLDGGQEADDIEYSKDEIKDYMTVDKKSGLSILQAPLTNEDSMSISSESLSVILKNIIVNGGYDYVICDTGNNTRDSTMIALEMADIILMIMTQNTNTANCDKAFMSTMETIKFDLSNAKLVINNIMPQKATKISVQEIVDFFPFECVGKIKFNTDVIKATNMAEPLAYQPDHEFTKQLRSIVTYILKQDDYEVDTKPKKKLLGFLHKDKS